MLDSIKQHGCVLVTGAHGQTADGDTIEKATEFVAALRVLKNDVLPKVVECNDFVVTFLDEAKNSRAAHPATVLELMNHTLEQKNKGGLVLPGYGRPVAQLKCVRKEEQEADGEWDLALYVMGSHFSNFHALKTGKVTAQKLGCVGLPDHLMDFEFSFAEQFRISGRAPLRSAAPRSLVCRACSRSIWQFSKSSWLPTSARSRRRRAAPSRCTRTSSTSRTKSLAW